MADHQVEDNKVLMDYAMSSTDGATTSIKRLLVIQAAHYESSLL